MDDATDEIIEYNPELDETQIIGQMLLARLDHAISVVQIKDFAHWCSI